MYLRTVAMRAPIIQSSQELFQRVYTHHIPFATHVPSLLLRWSAVPSWTKTLRPRRTAQYTYVPSHRGHESTNHPIIAGTVSARVYAPYLRCIKSHLATFALVCSSELDKNPTPQAYCAVHLCTFAPWP